jgi:hypothetical protein
MSAKLNTTSTAVELTQAELDSVTGGRGRGRLPKPGGVFPWEQPSAPNTWATRGSDPQPLPDNRTLATVHSIRR